MIGDRIKQARLMNRLTLDDVADHLSAKGFPLTKAALSNYEKGKRNPNAKILYLLAHVLKVKPSYFLSEPSISIEWIAFRCQTSLIKKHKNEIIAFAKNIAEKHIYLQETLFPNRKPSFPSSRKISTESEAENAAAHLRKLWNLGIAPIDSLTQTIEDKGGIVVEYKSESVRFDGLSGRANNKYPILVINSGIPDDRKRFDLAHELGHLVMNCQHLKPKEEESLAYRFAGALLLPKDSVFTNIGEKRKHILANELGYLKNKFGISMQACLRRALDLEIISNSYYKKTQIHFNKMKWKQKEPFNYLGTENPQKLHQLIYYGLTEGMITPNKAEELVPGASKAAESPTSIDSTIYSARDLMRLSKDKRNMALEKILNKAEKEYEENSELKELASFD